MKLSECTLTMFEGVEVKVEEIREVVDEEAVRVCSERNFPVRCRKRVFPKDYISWSNGWLLEIR